MKKTYRSFLCLLAVLLLSVSALPAASALFSERLYYYGTVEEISRAADGTVESVLVTAEGQETYEMVITFNLSQVSRLNPLTYILNADIGVWVNHFLGKL